MTDHRAKASRVLLYNGGFPLDFLRDDETVRKCGRDGTAEIERPGLIVRVKPGHWLVRYLDGTLGSQSFPPEGRS